MSEGHWRSLLFISNLLIKVLFIPTIELVQALSCPVQDSLKIQVDVVKLGTSRPLARWMDGDRVTFRLKLNLGYGWHWQVCSMCSRNTPAWLSGGRQSDLLLQKGESVTAPTAVRRFLYIKKGGRRQQGSYQVHNVPGSYAFKAGCDNEARVCLTRERLGQALATCP